MDFRNGILSTASSLGVDPLDLATAISYETAGTFDPTKRGPTTQWGQHRGLIQFGEPQAKKYGVDWNDPVGSQLGPQGAVANYLRDTGVKPGMGLIDIYSAINAGGVGRYNRTDANNGGAPGTVRDKVENQMAGHRRNAEKLLGSNLNQDIANQTMAALGRQPTQRQPTQRQPQGILGSAGDDNLNNGAEPMQDQQKASGIMGMLFPNMDADKQDRIAMALSGLSMHPNQGVMSMVQGRMADRRTDRKEAKGEARSAQMRNKTAEYIANSMGRPDLAQAVSEGIMSGADAYRVATQKADTPTPYSDQAKIASDLRNGLITPEQAQQAMSGGRNIDKDAISAANTIRDDANKSLEPYELARSGFENIQAFQKGGAVSDYALAVAFAKVLDPGSVAREGEVAAVANSGSIAGALQSAILKQLNDGATGSLPPAIRAEIVNLSTELYNKRADTAQGTVQGYRDMATRSNVDPRDVYIGPEPYFFEGSGPAGRPPARPAAQQPPPQQAQWNGPNAAQIQNMPIMELEAMVSAYPNMSAIPSDVLKAMTERLRKKAMTEGSRNGR